VTALLLLFLACGQPSTEPADTADHARGTDTGATALDGQAMGYDRAAACGECHPQHYDEWRRSMHAYSTRSPVFEAMAAKAYRDSAGEVGSFCSRCHSIIGDAEGDPGDVTYEERSALGQEGVTCDICHKATDHDLPLGNANLQQDPMGPALGPFDDASGRDHTVAASDFTASPELCGSCHDVFMYPGLAIEQAYSEYIDSPAAAAGTRCQDCHMGPTPGVFDPRPEEPIAVTDDGYDWPARPRSSHRFIGPDYALVDDWPFPDDLDASAAAQADNLELVEQLLQTAVRIADLRFVQDGGSMAVEVAVESLIDSHRVPTGFTSERQLWIDIEVVDVNGRTVLRSGELDAWGDLRDPHSQAVQDGSQALDAQLVNYQSDNWTVVRGYDNNGQFSTEGVEGLATFPFEAQEIVRHSLEPLERRTHRFALDDASAVPPLTVTVALRYRNLPPYVLRALQADDLVDRLIIFTLDEASASSP